VFESLALAENERDLNEIRAELAEQGYVRRKAGKKNQKQPALSAPLKFKTSDGFTVLVGRNNRQNDKLTMKDANNNDIWFHTKNIPGSHTVLVTDGKAPTETAMEGSRRACRAAQPREGCRAGAGRLHADPLCFKAAGRKARHGHLCAV